MTDHIPAGAARLTAGSTRMFLEAGHAPEFVAVQLERNAVVVARIAERLRRTPPRTIVTCARGSSDHAATFAKYLFETRCGLVTSSAAPSVSSLYASAQRMDDMLCLAVSQSGRSPDLLASVEAAKAAGAFTVALVNDESSPLAALAHEVVPLLAGPELSVAATKSYIATLAALLHLIAAWTADAELTAGLRRLPAELGAAWALDWTSALQPLAAATSLYVIARGVGLGPAQEAALKLKETCGLHAEAFSAAEVLHGPMALVGDGFPVLVFAQRDETFEGTMGVAERLAQRGANVFLAAPGAAPPGVTLLPTLGSHPAIEPALMVQSFYRLANGLSIARGLDPDNPPNLRKVTETI